jgi:hypothetical protein
LILTTVAKPVCMTLYFFIAGKWSIFWTCQSDKYVLTQTYLSMFLYIFPLSPSVLSKSNAFLVRFKERERSKVKSDVCGYCSFASFSFISITQKTIQFKRELLKYKLWHGRGNYMARQGKQVLLFL